MSEIEQLRKEVKELREIVQNFSLMQGGQLSGPEIVKRLGTDIIIDPFNEDNLNPGSYDLTLNPEIKFYTETSIDLSEKQQHVGTIIIPETGLWIKPGQFYLGKTNEYTETYNLVPKISGKSSAGRAPLFTNVSAHLGDDGFKGHWSIQLWAPYHKVKVYPNMKIMHLYYISIVGERKLYDGHYQNQTNPTFSSTVMGGRTYVPKGGYKNE